MHRGNRKRKEAREIREKKRHTMRLRGDIGDSASQSVSSAVAGVNTLTTTRQSEGERNTSNESNSVERTENVLPEQRGPPSGKDETERLKQEIAELKERALRVKQQELAELNSRYLREKQQLQWKNDLLQKDKELLQKDWELLQKDKELMQKHKELMQKDWEQLQKDEDRLPKDWKQLHKSEDFLQSEVDKLRAKVKELEEDKSRASKEFEKLKKNGITYEDAFTRPVLPNIVLFFGQHVSVGAPLTFPSTILPWRTCVPDATQAFTELNIPKNVMKSFLPFERPIERRNMDCKAEISAVIDSTIHSAALTFFRRLEGSYPFFIQMERKMGHGDEGIAYKGNYFMYKIKGDGEVHGFFVAIVKPYKMFFKPFYGHAVGRPTQELIEYISSNLGPATAVDQLVNFMISEKLKYGKLDTYDAVIYVKIEDKKLYMSKAFLHHDVWPTRLKMEVGILAMAMNDGKDFSGLDVGPFIHPKSESIPEDGSSKELSEIKGGHSSQGNNTSTTQSSDEVEESLETSRDSTRYAFFKDNDHTKIFDILAEKQGVEKMLKVTVRDTDLLVEGLYANTFLCDVDGIGGAICKAVRHSLGKEEMETELKMYRGPLLRLQGVNIPELYGAQSDVENGAMAMVLSHVKGVALDKVQEYRKYKELAKEALHQIHECGVLHGDIGLRNFILTSGMNKVIVLDFGRSQIEEFKVNKKAFDCEMKLLSVEF